MIIWPLVIRAAVPVLLPTFVLVSFPKLKLNHDGVLAPTMEHYDFGLQVGWILQGTIIAWNWNLEWGFNFQNFQWNT